MIDTALFDMSGTLEDIWIDDESKNESAQGVKSILQKHGFHVTEGMESIKKILADGWSTYSDYRNSSDRELKPDEIWGNYILKGLCISYSDNYPFAEELAYMWELAQIARG